MSRCIRYLGVWSLQLYWVSSYTSYVFWLQTTETNSESLLEVLKGYWKLPEMAENLENQIWKWIRNKASLKG